MINEQEVLELAAKAAGIKIHRGNGFQNDMLFIETKPDPSGKVVGREWNPLEDDGDALRLAVKLNLDLNFWGASVCAGVRGKRFDEVEYEGSSFHAQQSATRRAIVRAAAEIGKE